MRTYFAATLCVVAPFPFAFIFGVVPLLLAVGAGAEMRRALGTAVFSGMLGVTLFGIFLTPVFFYSIQWFKDVRDRLKKDRATSGPAPEGVTHIALVIRLCSLI